MSSHLTDEGVVMPTISIVPFSVLQHFYTVLMFSTIWFPRQPVAEGHWEIGIFPFELAFLFLVIESDPQTTIISVDWHTRTQKISVFVVSDLFVLFSISMNINGVFFFGLLLLSMSLIHCTFNHCSNVIEQVVKHKLYSKKSKLHVCSKLYQSTYFKAFLKKEVVFTDSRQLHQMRISYPAFVLANMQIVTTAILLVKRKSYFLLDSYTIFMRFATRYDQKNFFYKFNS